MKQKKIIIISLLLLAAAVGTLLVLVWPEKRIEPRRISIPRERVVAVFDLAEFFEPIGQVKAGETVEGNLGKFTIQQGIPSLRFETEEGYWADVSLAGANFVSTQERDGKIIYPEVFGATDIEYQTYDGLVKETIILKNPQAPKEFSFRLTLAPGLEAGEIEGGFIPIFKQSNKEQVMQLKQPVGIDMEGKGVGYEYHLEEFSNPNFQFSNPKEYLVKIIPSNLSHFQDAKYPISLDPSIQTVAWDEALVKVGENCAGIGCAKDGDVVTIKPAGWGWGLEERKKFVIVKIPKLTELQRQQFTARGDPAFVEPVDINDNRSDPYAAAYRYGLDYTLLAAPAQLKVIRDPTSQNPILDVTSLSLNILFKKKANLSGSVIPDALRLAYQPPKKPSGLTKFWKKIIPAAFAQTTVTKKIANGGGNNCPSGTACDYSTIQLWETGEDGDLVTLNEVHVGEIYNDGGVFNEDIVFDGSTTDATRYMKLTVASGERHSGTQGTGAEITTFDGSNGTIDINDDNIRIEWVEVDCHNSGTGSDGIKADGAGGATYISYVITHDCDGWGVEAGNVIGAVTRVWNSISYDNAYAFVGRQTTYFYNDTGYNSGTFNFYDGGTTVCKNCIAITGGGFDNETSFETDGSNYNMSSDTSAPGANSIKSETTGEFISVTAGSENLHLASGANAIDTGTDLSGDANLAFSDDIDAQTRPATWDMGADEIVVSNNTPTITSVTDTPDPTNPFRSVTFSTDWNDADSGETVKVKVCKSSTLASQSCSDGFWASSTAFTTSDPESLVYDIAGGDAGTTRNYFVHVCDDGASCTSTSTAGTFSVNAVSTVPDVKVRGGKARGGLKVR